MSIKDKQQRRQETQAAGDNRGQREPSPQLFPGAGPSLLSHFGRGLSGIGRPRPGAVRTAGVEGAGHVWGCHFRVTDHACSPDPGSRSPPSARGRHGTRSGRRVRWGRRQRPICDPVGWAAEQAQRLLSPKPPAPRGATWAGCSLAFCLPSTLGVFFKSCGEFVFGFQSIHTCLFRFQCLLIVLYSANVCGALILKESASQGPTQMRCFLT